jgi:hypothetical protein
MSLSDFSVTFLPGQPCILDQSNSVVGMEPMADRQIANSKVLIVGGGSGMGSGAGQTLS